MVHVVISVWKQRLALVFVDPTTSKPALFWTVDPTLDPTIDFSFQIQLGFKPSIIHMTIYQALITTTHHLIRRLLNFHTGLHSILQIGTMSSMIKDQSFNHICSFLWILGVLVVKGYLRTNLSPFDQLYKSATISSST